MCRVIRKSWLAAYNAPTQIHTFQHPLNGMAISPVSALAQES
jgi:hypothetical protein